MDNAVTQWKKDRQKLQKQLELMKSGKMKDGERVSGVGLIDTTADNIENCERYIAELEALIVRFSEAK